MDKHILIVDDDPDILKTLREGLRRHEGTWSVTGVGSGEAAIEVLERETVSLVVTDLKMPGMDGFGLMAHIIECFPDIPVIIISGYTNPQTEKLANESGAIGYIAKPFLVGDLAGKIVHAIQRETDGGTLKGVSSDVFLQLVELEGKTCTIRLMEKGSARKGVLFFLEGELIDARLDNLRGTDAAYEIISWQHVSLSIQNSCKSQERRIEEGLQAILLEAMRLKDEQKAAAETQSLPPHDVQSDEIESASTGSDTALIERLKSRMAELTDVEKIDVDGSIDEIINKFNNISEIFNGGRLKQAWLGMEEKPLRIIIPSSESVVLQVARHCGRDALFRLIGKTGGDLIL